MHILMKYLAIKLFILFYLFFPKSIYTSDLACSDFWFNKNIPQLTDKIINVKASMIINNDSSRIIELYIDRYNKRFRIDYDDQILILDQNKSTKIFINTNQLYIDNPDTVLYNIISSIFTGKYKYFNEESIESSYNKYLIKNQLGFNQIEIVYSDGCSNMNFIKLDSDKINILIDHIDIEIIESNSLFELSDKYFKYDLRP